jgi:transcriptional regulator with XRE-family HTH domain
MPAAAQALARMAGTAGQTAHDERLRRRWSLVDLAARAGISKSHLQDVEAGAPASLETYARVALALDLRPELRLVDPRRSPRAQRPDQDLVHAAMGEVIAARHKAVGRKVALDEPYQHYQFAGRADVIAWDVEQRALLHVENRTQFPNVQEALGSYGAKRNYLGPVLAERFGIGRWSTVTHVMAVLWSADVLRVLKLRATSFDAACPDGIAAFESWWNGELPPHRRVTSALVVFDPAPDLGRSRRFVALDVARGKAARYRNYADAAERLRG